MKTPMNNSRVIELGQRHMTPPLPPSAAEYRRQIRADSGETPPPARDFAIEWAFEITEPDIGDGGVIDSLLGDEGLTCCYGEPGSGKSFACVDLAARVAAGLPWQGLQTTQGAVAYIAAESPGSIRNRLWAWVDHHKAELLEQHVVALPVAVVKESLNLVADAEPLAAKLRELADRPGGLPWRLIVVDTLARASAGADENSARDMGAVIEAADALGRALKVHVLLVHHSGKAADRGARGSSALKGAVDCELEVAKGEDGTGTITVRKHRHEVGGTVYAFGLATVPLKENRHGRTVATCVVVESDPPAQATAKVKTKPLSDRQQIIYGAFGRALDEQGQAAPAVEGIPRGVRVVAVSKWREFSARFLADEDRPVMRVTQAFNDAVNGLRARGLIRLCDGWAWSPKGEHQTHQTHQTHQISDDLMLAADPHQTSDASDPPLRGSDTSDLIGAVAPVKVQVVEPAQPKGETKALRVRKPAQPKLKPDPTTADDAAWERLVQRAKGPADKLRVVERRLVAGDFSLTDDPAKPRQPDRPSERWWSPWVRMAVRYRRNIGASRKPTAAIKAFVAARPALAGEQGVRP